MAILAECGGRAELGAKQRLEATGRGFPEDREPSRKNEAGRDLIRSIFGKGSIAEDQVL